MRLSTQKILLVTYPFAQDGINKIPKTMVRELLRESGDAGFRSLLHHLVKQNMISVEKYDEEVFVIATQTGQRYLEQRFPWLTKAELSQVPDEEVGEIVIFKRGPAADARFRRLRRLSLENGGVGLARGIYYFKNHTPQGLMREIFTRYRSNVLIMKSNGVILGSISSTLVQESLSKELLEVSSGFSSQLNRLIMHKNADGYLNYQQKTHFLSLFNQINDLFGETRGKNVLPHNLMHQLRQLMELLQSLINGLK